jgi:hypothetical protein
MLLSKTAIAAGLFNFGAVVLVSYLIIALV